MKIGYARVSTLDQKLELQLDALNDYGVEKIFQEKITGTKADRPQLGEMTKILRKGDTVVVWKLDRIGRSMKHLVSLVEEFREVGIGFVSLKESIDTTTATGKLIFNIFASLAEFERDMLSERTKAGLKAAKARGRSGGRPNKRNGKAKTVEILYQNGIRINEIVRQTELSRATIYRILKLHKIAKEELDRSDFMQVPPETKTAKPEIQKLKEKVKEMEKPKMIERTFFKN
jgi:DNA invertase Pin-like site-specific DNA recombinase